MMQARIVIAVYWLIVEFPTPKGIGFIRFKKCHLNSLRILKSFKSKQDVMEIVGDAPDIPLEQLNCREETFKPQPVEKCQQSN